MTTKLKIQDYVFNYMDEDLKDAKVEYSFGKTVSIPTGEEREKVTFEISANSEKNIEYTLEFTLYLSKDDIDKLTDKLTKVDNKVMTGEMFLSNSEKKTTKLLDFNEEKHSPIYWIPDNCWVAKIDGRLFVKLFMATEKIFTWFFIDVE